MSQLNDRPKTKQVKIDARLHAVLKIAAVEKDTTIRAILEDRLNWIPIIPTVRERRKFKREKGQYGQN